MILNGSLQISTCYLGKSGVYSKERTGFKAALRLFCFVKLVRVVILNRLRPSPLELMELLDAPTINYINRNIREYFQTETGQTEVLSYTVF